MGKKAKTTSKSVKKRQPKIDLDLAIQVSDRIELESIRLMSCNCQQSHIVGLSQKSFDIERTTKSKMDSSTNRVFVFANFTLKAFETVTTNKNPFAIIEATFLLIYRANSLEGITDKALEHFGNANGIYNAWPYWREFVQNTIIRMDLPALTIPVFRIVAPPKPKKTKKKVATKKKVLAKRKKAVLNES